MTLLSEISGPLKLNVSLSMLISKDPVYAYRGWLLRFRDWIMFRKPTSTRYTVIYKFLTDVTPESALIRAGSIIMTDNGYAWFIMARADSSFICKSLEPGGMVEEQIEKMKNWTGIAILTAHANADSQI